MHGSSFRGDGAAQLRGLAAGYATIVEPTAALEYFATPSPRVSQDTRE